MERTAKVAIQRRVEQAEEELAYAEVPRSRPSLGSPLMNPWRFDTDDGSFDSWMTSGGHTLCNAGLLSSMALAELGSAPFELRQALPKAFSSYTMQLQTDEADPEDKINPSASRPQRDYPSALRNRCVRGSA